MASRTTERSKACAVSSAARFFYTAKVSRQEREAGLDHNPHPTLKPIALTTYLANLIQPPGDTNILVPFSGTGSEIIGALKAGWTHATGIEKEPEYATIANARVRHWIATPLDYGDQETLAQQAPLFAGADNA